MGNADKASNKWPKLQIKWHQSLITPIALIVSCILFVGIMSNVFIGVHNVNILTKLIHDDDIEKSLEAYLLRIKEVHTLRQKLIEEKLKPFVNSWVNSDHKNLSKIGIQTWLNTIGKDLIPKVELAMIDQIATSYNLQEGASPIIWLGKEELQILNFIVSFPKGALFDSFSKAKDVRQRYHVLGTELFLTIRTTLIKQNVIVLLVSFLLLGLSIFLFTNRLQRNLQTILTGFQSWRTNDFNFRFSDRLPGELGLIAKQFNAMARDIETTRQKTLYLEKVASWQVIARKLAHEIKNPLTPIQMMVSQLSRFYKGEDPKFKEILEKAQNIITEEVTSLRYMVDHFSNFARLPEPRQESTDLLPIISNTLELQSAAHPQHRFIFAPDLKEAPAYIDEKLVRQVLLNLTKNAAQACGQTPSEISIIVEEKSHFYFVFVNDNGPGIPEDIKSRIFEAYFTTKHTGPTPGMGLGLAICLKIVLDHGGEMSVESKPGLTSFKLSLPKHATYEDELIHTNTKN